MKTYLRHLIAHLQNTRYIALKHSKPLKYICVGFIATLIFYGVANILESHGINELIATCIGNIISFGFGYFAQGRFTFQAHIHHKTMIPRYLIVLVCICTYGQILTFLGGLVAIGYTYTSAFIALSVPIFSYPLQRFWVFDTSKNSNGGGGYKTLGFLALFSFIANITNTIFAMPIRTIHILDSLLSFQIQKPYKILPLRMSYLRAMPYALLMPLSPNKEFVC